MNSAKFLSLIFVTSFVACSSQEPTAKPGQPKTQVIASSPSADSTQSQNNANASVKDLALNFWKTNSVNMALCERLQKLKNLCQGKTRILDDIYSTQVLACSSQGSQELKLNKFMVSGGGGGQFVLVANSGIYYTNPFNADGSFQEVKWKSQSSQESKYLRDIESLEVRAYSADYTQVQKNPPVTLPGFKFKVNTDEVLMDESNFNANGRDNMVRLFQKFKGNENCIVKSAEIDVLQSQASANSAQTFSAQEAALSKMTKEELNTKIGEADNLTRFLRSELLEGANQGCWLDKKIEKLEINMTGSLNHQGLNRFFPDPHHDVVEGVAPDAAYIKLADNFEIGVPDFVTRLGGGAVNIIETNHTDKRIASLGKLFLRKTGHLSGRRYSGMGGDMAFEIFVYNTISIAGVTIKVNDQIVFQNPAVNKPIFYPFYQWDGEIDIRDNPAYQALYTRTDCK